MALSANRKFKTRTTSKSMLNINLAQAINEKQKKKDSPEDVEFRRLYEKLAHPESAALTWFSFRNLVQQSPLNKESENLLSPRSQRKNEPVPKDRKLEVSLERISESNEVSKEISKSPLPEHKSREEKTENLSNSKGSSNSLNWKPSIPSKTNSESNFRTSFTKQSKQLEDLAASLMELENCDFLKVESSSPRNETASIPEASEPKEQSSPTTHAKEEPIEIRDLNSENVAHILNELVETEQVYLDDLQTLVNLFLKPFQENQFLKEFQQPSDAKVIFSNISDILSLHRTLLGELKRNSNMPLNDQIITMAMTFVKVNFSFQIF